MEIRKNIFFLVIILVCSTNLFAQKPHSWRIFSKDNYTWLCSPSEFQVFCSSSRTVRPVSIDPSRVAKYFNDFVEHEGFLLVSSDAGLYQIDMNTLGSERISLPGDEIIPGKIAVDMDYIWLVTNKSIYAFDKLSREWQSYKLPEEIDTIVGAYSNGEEVFCLGRERLCRFSVSTEKWNSYKLDENISDSAAFYIGRNTFRIIEKSIIKQYQPNSFSWDKTDLIQPIVDFFDEDSVLYVSTGSGVVKLTTATGVTRKLDISGIDQIKVLTKNSDTLLIATPERIIKYDTKNSGMDFITYPQELNFSDLEKLSVLDAFVIAVGKNGIYFYDSDNRAWQTVPFASLKHKVKRLSWSDEGFKVKYSPGYQSVLTGSFEDIVSIKFKGYEYDTVYKKNGIDITKQTLMGLSSTSPIAKLTGIDTVKGLPLINLNYRTTDPHDRSLELFFNNTSKTTVPSKGIQYRGNRDDRLNYVKLGNTSNDQLSSISLPSTQIEGASVVIESRKRIENRDRKVIRLAAGSGYMKTRKVWRMLSFRPDGIYYLKERKKKSDIDSINDSEIIDEIAIDDSDTSDTLSKNTTRIIPGSVKVWIDGELFDSTQYTFYSEIGKLQFVSTAPVDPVSSIAVQYEVQTVPDGKISDVEFIPDHNFGLLHYGALTVTPHEYISARVGFTGMDSDAHYTNGTMEQQIISLSAPLEIRKQNLMLKLTPDLSYNSKTGAKAGSATLQSRFGKKAGIVFNCLAMDNEFVSTDTLTYGYGAIQNQYDITVSYDITQDFPVSYYQHRREASGGTESKYAAKTGVHIPGFPYLDITLSRNEIEHKTRTDTVRTAFDSLFSTKDKAHFRFYETSSRYLEKLTRMRKVGYEISHSEYRTESNDKNWVNGRMSTAEVTLSPIQAVSILGNLIYRSGIDADEMPSTILRPGLEVQTTDAPKGVDLNASYYFQYNRYSRADSSTDTITRALDLILKPGQWLSAFKWFSPRASFSQNICAEFGMMHPKLIDLITAQNSKQTTSTNGGFGIHIFPVNEILFRNFNEWSKTSMQSFFSTENDLQIWAGGKNYWQAIWNYTSDKNYHYGNIAYDRIILSWLRVKPKFIASYITDSIGTKLDFGPSFTLNLNFKDVKFIKSLFNSHDFKVTWTKRNEKEPNAPQIGYTFNLSTIILPNIQISNFETISFDKHQLFDFQSRVNLIVNF